MLQKSEVPNNFRLSHTSRESFSALHKLSAKHYNSYTSAISTIYANSIHFCIDRLKFFSFYNPEKK